jgi:hypothetical protein
MLETAYTLSPAPTILDSGVRRHGRPRDEGTVEGEFREVKE